MTPLLPALPVPRLPAGAEPRRFHLDCYAAQLTASGHDVRPAEAGQYGAGMTQGWLRVDGQLVRVTLDPDSRCLRGGWATVTATFTAREVDTLRALVARSCKRAQRRVETRTYTDDATAAYDREKADWLAQFGQRLADVAAGSPAGRPAPLDRYAEGRGPGR